MRDRPPRPWRRRPPPDAPSRGRARRPARRPCCRRRPTRRGGHRSSVADVLHEEAGEVVDQCARDEDALDRDAALAGVAEAGACALLGGVGQVGVLADDGRGVAAELEDQALAGRVARDGVSGGRAAGEADRSDDGAAGEEATRRPGRRGSPGPPRGARPASSISSTRRTELAGACGGGLTMVVLPAAKEAASLWARRLTGALKGVIATTTPTGRADGHRRGPDAAGPACRRQHLAADAAGLGGRSRPASPLPGWPRRARP